MPSAPAQHAPLAIAITAKRTALAVDPVLKPSPPGRRTSNMAATEPVQKLKHPVPPAAKATGPAATAGAGAIAGMEALVPDVIPKMAKQAMGVTFQRGVEVRMGNTLTCDQTATAPESISFKGPSSAYYTVMMVDPDAPSRVSARLRHWRHWLVINVPNSCDVKAGDTITEYTGPSPPKGSGLHRYAFLVYSQGTNRIAEKDAPVPDARGQFNVARFVNDMKLGDPLAANFFVCERN